MKIKDLDELKLNLKQIECGLDKIESLSKVLLDCIRGNNNLKSSDVENLTFVLKEKNLTVKEKFSSIEETFIM